MVDASSGSDPEGTEGPTDQDRLGIEQASSETPSRQDIQDRVVYLLAEYKVLVSIALVAGFLALASGWWRFPALPPKLVLAAKWFAVGIVPAAVIAKKTVVAWFVPDNRYRVLVLDPEHGVAARDVAVPRRLWTTRRHEKGRPAITPSRGNIDAVVRQFDYLDERDQVVVEGCNPDVANPVDVTVTDRRISRIYDSLLDAKEDLRDLRATLDARVQEIQGANLNAVMASIEKQLAVNPEDARDMVREDSSTDVSRPLSTDGRDHDRDDDERDVQDASDDGSAPDRDATDAERVVDEVAENPEDVLGDDSQLPARADGGESE